LGGWPSGQMNKIIVEPTPRMSNIDFH